jgi:RNA polymerase-binding transcription factor
MRDDIDLEYFKRRIEERLVAITEGQSRQNKMTATVELDQARVGRLTRMDAMQQQAMSQATARLTEQERQRLQSASARMKSGDFGYCVICEEEIAEGRLRFDPSVQTCISCARESDKERSGSGRR